MMWISSPSLAFSMNLWDVSCISMRSWCSSSERLTCVASERQDVLSVSKALMRI